MRKRRFIVPMGVIFAVAGLAGPVEAAIEIEDGSYGTAASPLAVGSSESLNLGEFDPSLGTLTGVTVRLSSYDIITSDVFNYTGGSASYTGATAAATVMVTASDNLTTTATGTAGPFAGTSTAAGLSVAGSILIDPAQSSASIAPGDFSQYEGLGEISVNVALANLPGFYSGSSGASLFFGGNGFSYGDVQIEYEYTPMVPEPGTIGAGLAALSLCGIIIARRVRGHRVVSQARAME